MKSTVPHVCAALLASFFFTAVPVAHAALGGDSGIVIPYAGKLELNGALVTGTVVFRFDVLESSAPPTVCQTKEIPEVPVPNGEFAVTISGVSEACVKGKDVHLQIAVKQSTNGSFVVLGKQRVTPVLGALTSGPGDFAVTGALTANSAAVTGALSAGATTVTGNLSVSGFAFVGFQYVTCNNVDFCRCPPDGSTIVFGGATCGSNNGSIRRSVATVGTNDLVNQWKAECVGDSVSVITIGCARFR